MGYTNLQERKKINGFPTWHWHSISLGKQNGLTFAIMDNEGDIAAKNIEETNELIKNWKGLQKRKARSEPIKEKRKLYHQYWNEVNEERQLEKKSRQEKIQQNILRKKEARTIPKVPSPPPEDPENKEGRPWTVSVAIPGSAVDSIDSGELQTYICGQIARALTVFNVDEVVIYDDRLEKPEDGSYDPVMLRMARVLQYLECPQYLRKFLFPVHDDLKFAGLLNPLDAPHHLRKDEFNVYREGVVVSKGVDTKTFACVGTKHNALLDQTLVTGTRVTIKIKSRSMFAMPRGTPVHHSEPRIVAGKYWGYEVRLAHSLGEVFTQSPYQDGYDVTLGNDPVGESISGVNLPSFRHLLYVVAGERDLTQVLASDTKLAIKTPQDLFDICVNPCAPLKCETIRLDETLLVSLGALRSKIVQTKCQ